MTSVRRERRPATDADGPPSGPWRRWLVPAAFVGITVLGLLVAVWGRFIAPPHVDVIDFDAGPVDGLEIGGVRAFADFDVYLVGLDDGRVRAVDGRVRSSGCAVQWLPQDTRAHDANPAGASGAFLDPCTGALWAIDGDQVIAAGEPEALRTFAITFDTLDDGVQHVFIELIGRPPPAD